MTEDRLDRMEQALDDMRMEMNAVHGAVNALSALMRPSWIVRFISQPAITVFLMTLGVGAVGFTVRLGFAVLEHAEQFAVVYQMAGNAATNFETVANELNRLCDIAGRAHGMRCARTPMRPLQPMIREGAVYGGVR